jgi:Xaa-Pro aminopeptidase
MTRREKALAEAKDVIDTFELNALAYLFDGVHSYLEANPIYDLTGFKSIDCSAAIIEDNNVDLLLTPDWDVLRARECAPFYVKAVGCDDLAEVLVSRLVGVNRLGVVGLDAVPRSITDAVLRTVSEVVDVSEVVIQRQRPKDEDELIKAARATEIAEEAFGVLLENLRPGMAEYEVSALLDFEVRRRGADDNFLLMSSGPSGRPVHAASERRLEPGDVLNAEISPAYGYQFVQITRTIVLGRASVEQREDYELLLRSLHAGMAAARPGVTVAEVVAEMDRPSIEAGFPEYTRPPYIRVRGHGQGIASLSPGDIVYNNNTILEEGMMFTMHPNQPTPRSGYMMCGEPVVITARGAQALTSQQIRLFETGELK